MGRIHLWALLGKSGAPGAAGHVPAGLLNTVATSQGERLFVHAIYKVDLGPTMEWGSLAYWKITHKFLITELAF